MKIKVEKERLQYVLYMLEREGLISMEEDEERKRTENVRKYKIKEGGECSITRVVRKVVCVIL